MRNLMSAFLLAIISLQVAAAPLRQTLAAARIIAAARAQVDTRLVNDKAANTVTVIGKPEGMKLPDGHVELKAHTLVGRWPRSRVGVPVDILVDGRIVRSATVWFSLSVSKSVLMYGADATMGTEAGALAYVTQDSDVAILRGDVVGDPADLAGMRLRRAVDANKPVVRQDFEPIPEVDRQERVRVELAFGSIKMQTKGTAISKGCTGDVVPVIVDDAEGPVRARITGKGVVEVVY